VSERFELPVTFCGALRYEDPDGDLISVSTDDEVAEALRLCGDGKTLKMTLSPARDSAPAVAVPAGEVAVGKPWAGALSNVFEDKAAAAPAAPVDCPSSPASVPSVSGEFEMVESDSRPASVRSSAAASQAAASRPESAEEEDAALQAALKASAEEEAARVAAEEAAARLAAEEAARKAAEEEAARLAAEEVARKASEEEAARLAAEEAARVAAEEEAARKAAEEEAARLAAEEAARVAAEEEAARKAAEEEAARAEEAARVAAEEEASRRAAQELAARVAAEEEAVRKAEEEAATAEAEAAEEKRARLEIAFAAAEEDAMRRADELFNLGCTVDKIRSLYGESILMQLRLVPRMSDVHNEVPVVPEPVVNWEAAKAVSEQLEEERFPSDEQAAVVDEVGDLAARLTAFYFEYCPSMIDSVGEVSRKFVGREQELNDALLRKYKCDLHSFAAKHAEALAAQEQQDAAAARQLADEERVEDAHSQVAAEEEEEPMGEELREAIANMESMGFSDRTANLALLQKHNCNVEAAVNELIG